MVPAGIKEALPAMLPGALAVHKEPGGDLLVSNGRRIQRLRLSTGGQWMDVTGILERFRSKAQAQAIALDGTPVVVIQAHFRTKPLDPDRYR